MKYEGTVYRHPQVSLTVNLQTLREIQRMVENIDAEGSRLLSDHAMNYAPVQGLLAQGKPAILAALESALLVPENRARKTGIVDNML